MTYADRVKAITESPEAKGREDLAEHLAKDTNLPVAQALEALSHAPVDMESPSFSMRKSMERVISQMGHLRAAAARDAAKSQPKSQPRVEARAEADPGDVEPRMSLA